MTPIECGADCANCPYSKDGKPHELVPYDGPNGAVAVLVGESPGHREVEEGRPFVGPTGEKLGEALRLARIPEDSVFKINVIACKPNEPKEEKEMEAAAKACRPYFAHGMELHKGKPVLAMGSHAKAALGIGGAVQKARGFLYPKDKPWAIVTWHPTYAAFHNPYEWGNFLVDVQRFGRLIRKELKPLYNNITPVAKLSDVVRILKKAKQSGRLSLDIETLPENRHEPWTGKQPTRARLRQIGISSQLDACSLHLDGMNNTTRKILQQAFLDEGIVKIGLNLHWFDLPVLKRHGYEVTNVRDSRDLRRANMANSSLSLRYQGSISCDIHNWKSQDDADGDEKSKGGWRTKNQEEAGEYNCLDCIVTEHVDDMNMGDHQAEISRGAPVVKLYDVHTDLSKFAEGMHTRGMYVRKDWLGFLQWFLNESVIEKRRKVCEAVENQFGIPVDYSASEDADDKMWRATANCLRALLYQRHAKPDWPTFGAADPTDKRMYTDKDTLKTISVDEDRLRIAYVSDVLPKESWPILELWLDYQGEMKRRSAMCSKELLEAIGRDGRLRPSWNSCGTETMRFACSEPNVMNIEQQLRHIFGPPPGYAWVHADKAQLELRVMAVVANDDNLKKAIRSGDVYSYDAIHWFKLPPDTNVKKNHPKVRQNCKIIHLAKNYAATDLTVWMQALAENMEFKLSQVQALSRGYEALYYRVCQYWYEEQKRVAQYHYSEGRILGGRVYYPVMPDLSEIANKPIQRTAGEMMNVETLELLNAIRRSGLDAYPVVQLHDALDIECREEDVDKVKSLMLEVMNRDWTFCNQTFPFPVEIKVTYARDGLSGTWAEV